MRSRAWCVLAVAALALAGAAPSGQCAPYIDPSLLDVPWGNYSFVRQGWRGYLETVPAARYRDGLGVVWGQSPPHSSPDEVAATLAWAGFSRVRFEIPWGSVKWDEAGLDEQSEQRAVGVLRALRAHGLRPLILLNANHLQPCPVQWREWRVRQTAPAGGRTLNVSGEVEGPADGSVATIMSLADGTTAGPLVTSATPAAEAGGSVWRIDLSKPLSRPLASGERLRVALLRYPPLYPVGTPQFEATASGWLHYVELVSNLVTRTYGSDRYDIEIWNELTFGSAYLDVNSYREPHAALRASDFLHSGGSAWELASRTVRLLKREHPETQVIWGFSNTSFFHVPIADLPARIDGQSYHPYGTGRRCYADLTRGRRALLLDDFVPADCAVEPEGYAHTWQQTESLLRLIAPAARSAHPAGTASFQHFITEHGFSPGGIGITDAREAQHAKEGFLLRAPLLWINKGLSALYVYDLYDKDDTGFGLLRNDGGISPALSALHRMTAEFAGPETVGTARQLALEIFREGDPAGVLPGDPDGKHLPQEQAAAFLPFQVDAARFVVAAYVMTVDFPRPLGPQPYRVTVSGLDGRRATVKYYSPASDASWPVQIVGRTDRSITLRLSLVEIPNLLMIEETPSRPHRGAV
jgi:hypothetical protein